MLARTPKSRMMALIDKLVDGLPPFPLGAPLPVMGTTDQFADHPCSNPERRKGYPSINRVCMCGWNLDDHAKGGAL